MNEPEEFAISVVADRHLQQDIDIAIQSASQSIFNVLNAKLRDATVAAYPVYLQILANREVALAAIRNTPPYDKRQRAPKGDAATIALTLTTVPKGRRECSAVSDYGCFLILAGQQNVPPESYLGWLAGVPILKKVVLSVRTQRAKPKAADFAQVGPESLEPTTDPVGELGPSRSLGDTQQDPQSGPPSSTLRHTNCIRVTLEHAHSPDGITHRNVSLPRRLAHQLAEKMHGTHPREPLQALVKALFSILEPAQKRRIVADLRFGGRVGRSSQPMKAADSKAHRKRIATVKGAPKRNLISVLPKL